MRFRSMMIPALLVACSFSSQCVQAQFATGLYVSNVTAGGTAEVVMLGPGNAPPIVVETSGLSAPTGIGFSPNSALMYVADAVNDTVNVYNNTNSAPLQSISLAIPGVTSSSPADLTVDAAGNVYVAMHDQATGTDSILQIKNAGTSPVVSVFLHQGIALATGLTVTGGKLYVGLTGGGYGNDVNGGKVFQVDTGNSVSQYPNSGSTFGRGNSGLATDGTYLYLATSTLHNHGLIEKILLSTGAVTTISTSLTVPPFGLTLDLAGNLYFDDTNGDVYKIANAASISSPVSPTLFNNSLEADSNAGNGPTYLSYSPGYHGVGPTATGTPEPGSLAMSGALAFAGLAGYGWRRRRSAKSASEA